MAERVGFEPTVAQGTTTVFETVPFNRSGTSPLERLSGRIIPLFHGFGNYPGGAALNLGDIALVRIDDLLHAAGLNFFFERQGSARLAVHEEDA